LSAPLTSEDLSGTVLQSRFRLTQRVGAGGMGAVYLADDSETGKQVAVKVLGEKHLLQTDVQTRFVREAKLLARVSSPYVVKIYQAGVHDGRPYLAMELLEGEDLGQRLRRSGTLPVPETLQIMTRVLKALQVTHAAGIVHRDLKPDNIFLTRDGGVKVLDFGLSKAAPTPGTTVQLGVTGTGRVVGTPLYLAPEQARGLPTDGRSDIYSLGALVYECLCGRPPHLGKNNEQVLLAHCTKDAKPLATLDPRISLEVSDLVGRALRRDPAERYADAGRFLAEVRRVRDAGRSPWRRHLPMALLAVSCLAVGAIMTFLLLRR
jgi:eukaryotic-like serine/threonine-protein kinase